MNIENEDYRDASELHDLIEKAKNCSTRVINYVIKELEVELQERDSTYIKSMQEPLSFGK